MSDYASLIRPTVMAAAGERADRSRTARPGPREAVTLARRGAARICAVTPPFLVLGCLVLPVLASGLIVLARNTPNLREAVTLVTAALVLGCVLGLYPEVSQGFRPGLVLAPLVPGIPLKLVVEPLGLLFAMVAGFLWLVTSIYSIGYMRAHHEKNQTRFYACFAVSIAATMGVAFADNLVTLFVFYEALTLSTYPLVTHAGTAEARRAGRVYLATLLGTSIGFQLLAIAWTYAYAGTVDFRDGGILAGRMPDGGRRGGVLPVRVRHRQGRSHAVPPLAPGRDGGPDPGQRAAARGGGGEGRGVHDSEGRGVRVRPRAARRRAGEGGSSPTSPARRSSSARS